MSALICRRPSSIDRRDKRLGNGQARSRPHRIKRAVGPIRPRSFRVHANYLDALNTSRGADPSLEAEGTRPEVRLRIYVASLYQGSPASGYRLLEVVLVPHKLKRDPLIRSPRRRCSPAQTRRSNETEVAAQCSAISDIGSHFETGFEATTTPIAPPSRGCLFFPCRRSSQSSLTQKILAASTRRTA